MPYIRIFIHLIFATKYPEKIITTDLKSKLLAHIKQNSITKEIFIIALNCTSDHIHILLSLSSDQSICKVAQLIKGESSCWVNKNNLLNRKFEWQDDYIALSVSNSAVEKVKEYIKNQEAHHRVKLYSEEYDGYIKKYGADLVKS